MYTVNYEYNGHLFAEQFPNRVEAYLFCIANPISVLSITDPKGNELHKEEDEMRGLPIDWDEAVDFVEF